jgi:hypothetical protein
MQFQTLSGAAYDDFRSSLCCCYHIFSYNGLTGLRCHIYVAISVIHMGLHVNLRDSCGVYVSIDLITDGPMQLTSRSRQPGRRVPRADGPMKLMSQSTSLIGGSHGDLTTFPPPTWPTWQVPQADRTAPRRWLAGPTRATWQAGPTEGPDNVSTIDLANLRGPTGWRNSGSDQCHLTGGVHFEK